MFNKIIDAIALFMISVLCAIGVLCISTIVITVILAVMT